MDRNDRKIEQFLLRNLLSLSYGIVVSFKLYMCYKEIHILILVCCSLKFELLDEPLYPQSWGHKNLSSSVALIIQL